LVKLPVFLAKRHARKRKNQSVEGSFLSHAFIAQAERSLRTICLGSYPFQAMTATGFCQIFDHAPPSFEFKDLADETR
jgi:hypothetical protein